MLWGHLGEDVVVDVEGRLEEKRREQRVQDRMRVLPGGGRGRAVGHRAAPAFEAIWAVLPAAAVCVPPPGWMASR